MEDDWNNMDAGDAGTPAVGEIFESYPPKKNEEMKVAGKKMAWSNMVCDVSSIMQPTVPDYI